MATPHKKPSQPETKIVNILHTKDYHVYIGRVGFGMDGTFGNPFKLWKDGDRDQILQKFRTYFFKRLNNDPQYLAQVQTLKGKILGCFCSPRPCHGDVIVEYLNQL